MAIIRRPMTKYRPQQASVFLIVMNDGHVPVGYISRNELIQVQIEKFADDRVVESGGLGKYFGERGKQNVSER